MEARFARMQELVRGVREVRNRYKVDDKTRARRVGEVLATRWRPTSRALAPFIGAAGRRRQRSTAGPTRAKPKQAGDAWCGRSSRRTCRSPG